MDRMEKEFQRWLRAELKLWTSSVEYGIGGDAGFPDMVIGGGWPLALRGVAYLVELKVGEVRHGRLFPRDVRPAQIEWHRAAVSEGGQRCGLFVGVKRSGWDVYAVKSENMVNWKLGYPLHSVDDGAFLLTQQPDLTTSALSWLRSFA